MIILDYEDFSRANVHPRTANVEFEFFAKQDAVQIRASAHAFGEFMRYLTDVQRALQRQASPVGAPIAAIPIEMTLAEKHRTGNVLALLRGAEGPIDGYSLHPQLARAFAAQLIEAAEKAERDGPARAN